MTKLLLDFVTVKFAHLVCTVVSFHTWLKASTMGDDVISLRKNRISNFFFRLMMGTFIFTVSQQLPINIVCA